MFWCGGRRFRSPACIQASFLQLSHILTLGLTFPVCEKMILFPGSREPECPSPGRWHHERASWVLAQRPGLSQNQKPGPGALTGRGQHSPKSLSCWFVIVSSLASFQNLIRIFSLWALCKTSLAYEREKRYFKLRVVFVRVIKALLTIFLPHN